MVSSISRPVSFFKVLPNLVQKLPKKTVVVGAGYIAVELAGMLANLGSETHLLIRYDQVLRTFDETLSTMLTDAIVDGPINLHKQTQVLFT